MSAEARPSTGNPMPWLPTGNTRHQSEQCVSTPREFIEAVQTRFGTIGLDLAANESNHVVDRWYGPGSGACWDLGLGVPDSLGADWTAYMPGLLWLNPPFKNIAPWAAKCADERKRGARIALLVPASVCTNWFVEHVKPHAYVFELTPRVFKNEIRDCILALYEPAGYVGRETWKWR